MAFPYVFQADFETGDFSQFTTVTNPGTPTQMVAAHYTTCVQRNAGEVPYRGAYCQLCDLSLGSADAFVATAALTVVGQSGVRFFLAVSPNLRMATGDSLTLARIDCGVDQTTFTLDNTTPPPRLVVTGSYAAGQTRPVGLILGQWHCIEMTAIAANAQIYVNGGQAGAPLAGLASPLVTGVRLGTMGIDAGTTQGLVLFDGLVVDDGRVYGFPERYPQIVTVTSPGVVIPGSGRYERFNLIAGHDTDNVIQLVDSDVAGPGPEQFLAPTLTSTVANREYHVSKRAGYFQYGLKVNMTGTAPQAVIVLGHALCSAGAIAEWARRRPLVRVA